MKIPRHYPAFRYFVTDDEDRLYVLTWERPPDRKGRLYAAEETAEGYPVLKRYRVRWKFR